MIIQKGSEEGPRLFLVDETGVFLDTRAEPFTTEDSMVELGRKVGWLGAQVSELELALQGATQLATDKQQEVERLTFALAAKEAVEAARLGAELEDLWLELKKEKERSK